MLSWTFAAWIMHDTLRKWTKICLLQVVKFASKEDKSRPVVTDADIGIVGYVGMVKNVYNT